MTSQTDQRWMAAALAVGRRGMGQSADNPSVGCVIVQGDRIVGQGWTQAGGRPHAEVMAISMAQQNAVGATAYVTWNRAHIMVNQVRVLTRWSQRAFGVWSSRCVIPIPV